MSPGSFPILKEPRIPVRIPRTIKNKPVIKKMEEIDLNI